MTENQKFVCPVCGRDHRHGVRGIEVVGSSVFEGTNAEGEPAKWTRTPFLATCPRTEKLFWWVVEKGVAGGKAFERIELYNACQTCHAMIQHPYKLKDGICVDCFYGEKNYEEHEK